ncbi:hypothetical protein AGOR_G00046730 [Albula goreensis]|uniref:Sushi domain-containing protein n=1 Tax=Albula goreensis TaxID=1534307 RepID=A0A8T3DZM9_9TELE|nr:hypothetical protein AGOR_G00046730 [Albula goreensis]
MLVFKLIILIQAVLNPVVAEVLCSKDVNITKGQVEFLEGRGVGSVLQYTCPNHHRASPVSWRVCGADGKWSPIRQPAACVMYHCSGPVTLENGWVSPRLAVYSVGKTVEFQCRPGYTHYGAPNITCLPTGKWSAPPAVCDTEVKSFCGDPGVPAGGSGWDGGLRRERGSGIPATGAWC